MAKLSSQDRAFLEGIFHLMCTSRLNTFYYEMRLNRIQRENFLIELLIAASASGSAIAGLGFWKDNPVGQWVWAGLTLIAAGAAIIKPLYAPSRKIELFTRQHQSYHNNYFALQKLVYALQQSTTIADNHRKNFETIFDRHVQLSGEDEAAPKRRVLMAAEERCSKALPPENFWRHWADRVETTTSSDVDHKMESTEPSTESAPGTVRMTVLPESSVRPAMSDPQEGRVMK